MTLFLFKQMQLSKKEKRIIVTIIVIAVFVTLVSPIVSNLYFLAFNYSKFYKPFPLEQILEINYELKYHHLSNSILAVTGLPLLFSIPTVGSYGELVSGPRAEYSYSLIPFLVLQWVPWISIAVSYLLTRGMIKWKRGLYIYLIAVYLGVLNTAALPGFSSFDIFTQIK
ncbi:hypothetical protein [Nitrosopumilus sp.]|uniref:hypothetical protein n=1 Tax=Nitrosopumilus sp. TaxID=2024843 RepID=UPI00292ED4EA|nr:hypothetical protein [Nitrosopumilus sp.]